MLTLHDKASFKLQIAHRLSPLTTHPIVIFNLKKSAARIGAEKTYGMGPHASPCSDLVYTSVLLTETRSCLSKIV